MKNRLFPTWGGGIYEIDWKLAATNCANALHKHAPDQLVFIEGLNYANKMDMIKESPIVLD